MEKIRTKILCTIGPASWDKKVLKQMVDAGMTMARVNGAFADNKELDRVGKLIREASKDVALVLDIKGTEVRLNKFEEPKQISVGDEVVIGNKEDDGIYPITYPNLYKDIKPEDILLLDDGKVKLKVTKVADKKIYAKVKFGKEIKPGKSINTPGISLSNPPITDRDIEQIKFAVENNWDFIAASFVRTKDDILEVKKHIGKSDIKILAKIENDEGVENVEEILSECGGIIIARGDLGVEMPFAKVPIIQKQITQICLEQAKPAIVATQMLESMIENPNATRAEINDVANSVLDGGDSVWLSGETSMGKYPVDAVKTLNIISKETEQYVEPQLIYSEPIDIDPVTVALARGVLDICESINIDKIVVATGTGRTARVISSYKPRQPIIALTSNEMFKNQLLANWGVFPYVFDTEYDDRDEGVNKIVEQVIKVKAVDPKDHIVLVRGTTPVFKRTNSLEVGIARELTKN